MELNELENLAERENIKITNYRMKKKKARIVNYGSPYIFMDYSKIDSQTEEKCILAEELGHYYYDAYYTINSDQTLINKQEFRANKWAFKQLISPTKIKNLLSQGINTKYEIAEELGVTEDLLCLAYQYYTENSYI